MFAILGATGKIGGATIRTLRAAGQPVRAVVRAPEAAASFDAMGCQVAVADLNDAEALVRALGGATIVQAICPLVPAAPDAGGAMRQIIDSLAAAIATVKPQAALAISDYGAEIESGTGITTLFHELEQRLGELTVRTIMLRSAEHMENWRRMLRPALQTGRLASLHHPLTKRFPTLSAADVGTLSARLLMQEMDGALEGDIFHAEGPERYTAVDVARVFSEHLRRDIVEWELPRTAWHQMLVDAGQTDSGARLVTELYDAHNRGLIDAQTSIGPILRGKTTLTEALRAALAV